MQYEINQITISCNVDQTFCGQSRLMLVCVTEDQVDGRRARAEAAADGSRCGHEEQRLSLHRPVLRGSFQRGLSVLSAEHLVFSQRVFLTQNTYFVFFRGTAGYAWSSCLPPSTNSTNTFIPL